MLLLYDSNINSNIMDNVILMSVLTPNEYALLQLILSIRKRLREAKKAKSEPIFTLQQNYIATLFRCSPNTLISSIDKLCDFGVIEQVSNYFGACAEYKFNENGYKELISKASNQQCILKTGRKKLPNLVTAKKIFSFIIGKSMKKNE